MSEATLEEPTPELEATPAPAAEESDAPTCEKCGSPSDAAACPKCGWYPSLGIFVEIDEAFEAVMNGEPAAADPADEAVKDDWRKHLEVWNGLIPMWAWLMIGTTLGVVGAGVAARVATLSSPSLQTMIGVSGLIAGAAVGVLAHLVGFLLCSSEDADFGVFDLIIKPLKTWKRLAGQLPERLWLANSANLGVSVALSSALIVGGIPYDRLLDWGYKAKAKKTLVAMIAEKAANTPGSGADNLEDAVGDFAGQAGDVGPGDTPKPVAAKPRKKLEALMIGYQTDSEGHLRAVLLAADRLGKLKYAGRVKPRLPEKEAAELLARFEANGSSRPLVRTPEAGSWLRPKFMCRVTYTDWPDNKRPKDLEWDEMLDDVKLPW